MNPRYCYKKNSYKFSVRQQLFRGTINTSSTEVKNLGVTPPISTAIPRPQDLSKNTELKSYLFKHNPFESEEELAHRMKILNKLNMLVKQWIKDISIKKNMPPNVADIAGGTVYIFGSHRLGIHIKGSDIDTLCVAPRHIERTDFFSSFVEVLKEQKEVKNIRSIQAAYVPVIKMTFDGMELDLLFARLALKSVPDNQDISNVNLLQNLDVQCVRSLNGLRVTDEILNLVPNKENFRLALSAIKLWAKKQGIYSNKMGYLGGVSWAMLVARTCQLYPNACSATLVHKFFLIFSEWRWPEPVLLKQPEIKDFGFPVWAPRKNAGDHFDLMPIITPCYPQQNSTFNVSFSTRTVMQERFRNGLYIMTEIMSNKDTWDQLFKPVNFFTLYNHYIVLTATAPTEKDHLEWYGLVEAKIRILVAHLERYPNINIAHVHPDTFTPINPEPGTYQSMWSLGLQFSKTSVRLDLTHDMQQFVDSITLHASNLNVYRKGMKIDIKPVKRKELSKYFHPDILGKREKEKVLNGSCSAMIKKRPLDEDSQDGSQRSKRQSVDSAPI